MNIQHEIENPTVSLLHLSPKVLALNFNCVLLVGFFLGVFWPKQALFHYIATQKIPALFPGTFIAALIIMSYVDLMSGGGELIEEPKYPFLLGRRIIPFEITYNFFPHGFVQFWLSSLLLLLVLLPMLFIAAAVSKVSMLACLKAISILSVTSLMFRFFGLFAFFVFGPQHILGYFLSRIFFLGFMAATGFFARPINPIYQILLLYKARPVMLWSSVDIYGMYMLAMLVWIVLLTLVNHVMAAHIQRQKKKKWQTTLDS